MQKQSSTNAKYYNESSKKADLKYKKEKTRGILIRYRNEDYDRISGAIKKSGLPVATFIKHAINEKIERDGLLGSEEIW